MDKSSYDSSLDTNYSRAAAAENIRVIRVSLLALALAAALSIPYQVAAENPADEFERLMRAADDLLKQGAEEKAAGENYRHAGNFAEALPHYERAIALDEKALAGFKSAEKYAPQDKQKHAVFFEGVALLEKAHAIVFYNRASPNPRRGGQQTFCAGLHKIRRSMSLGMTVNDNASLYFELGTALVASSENEEGIQALDQFLASHQGTPAQEDEANVLKDDARKAIDAAKATKPSPMCGKALSTRKTPTTEDKPAPSAKQTEQQFVCSISAGIGYDGNVTKLGRDLPLPNGLAGKGAAFSDVTLSLENDWFMYHKKGEDDLIDKLVANYSIIRDAYDEHSASNTLGQTGLISYCHAVNSKLCIGLQIGDTWLRDDTKDLSNTLAPQVSATYQEYDQAAAKISYTLGWNKYFTPSTPQTTLDGFTSRIALEQSYIVIQAYRKWSPTLTVTGQFGHEWTTTNGIVGDRNRENPLLKAEWVIFKAPNLCSFVRSVTFASSYEYRHDEYCNATFPNLTAINRYHRRDDTHLADFAASVKMWYDEKTKNRLELIVDFKSTSDNSNVPAKAFDQPRFVASIKFNF